MSSDILSAWVLAAIYPSLPYHIKNRVLIDILNRCGYKFSMEDLEPPPPPPSSPTAVAVYRPPIFCFHCQKILHQPKKDEEVTPEFRAKLLDEHLPDCPVFQVIEKHRIKSVEKG